MPAYVSDGSIFFHGGLSASLEQECEPFHNFLAGFIYHVSFFPLESIPPRLFLSPLPIFQILGPISFRFLASPKINHICFPPESFN